MSRNGLEDLLNDNMTAPGLYPIVHLTGEDLPLVGDQVYRGRAPGLGVPLENLYDFHRQALHASRLGFLHPVTGEYREWFVEPDEDMANLMEDIGFGPLDRPVTAFEKALVDLAVR